MATRKNSNVQSYDQEKSKLSNTINTNSSTYILTLDKTIKKTLKRKNVKTTKSK